MSIDALSAQDLLLALNATYFETGALTAQLDTMYKRYSLVAKLYDAQGHPDAAEAVRSVLNELDLIMRGEPVPTLVVELDPLCVEQPEDGEDLEDLRELLADLAHDQWSGWMRYLFSKCDTTGDGSCDAIIPPELVERWTRQMNTPYILLPEAEKNSDRKEAEKVVAVLEEWLDE